MVNIVIHLTYIRTCLHNSFWKFVWLTWGLLSWLKFVWLFLGFSLLVLPWKYFIMELLCCVVSCWVRVRINVDCLVVITLCTQILWNVTWNNASNELFMAQPQWHWFISSFTFYCVRVCSCTYVCLLNVHWHGLCGVCVRLRLRVRMCVCTQHGLTPITVNSKQMNCLHSTAGSRRNTWLEIPNYG